MNQRDNQRSYSNFTKKDGSKALVKCPKCHFENYAPNVLSGICSWCYFDINAKDKK